MGPGHAELGSPRIDHRKNHCLWFGEENSICTKTGATRVVGSRVRGTWHRLGVQGVFPRVWYLQAVAA